MARVYSVMATDRMPVRNLLDTDGRRLDPIAMDQKYSRGWLLIHYLLLSGERGNQFTDYIRRVNSGTPSVEAGREAFGDLRRLDLDLDSYRRRPDLPVLRLTGLYLALATLAFAAIMDKMVFQAEWAFGFNGLLPAKRLSFFGQTVGTTGGYVLVMTVFLVLTAWAVLLLRRTLFGNG